MIITYEDLERVVLLARRAAANSDDRAAVWAIEREMATAPREAADTVWCMEIFPLDGP